MLVSNLRLFVCCNVRDAHLSEIQKKTVLLLRTDIKFRNSNNKLMLHQINIT